jgi:CHASE2 domain-containing sensor protein
MRDVLDVLSAVVGVALLVVAVLASLAAWRLPMEAGGLLFSPLLFMGALYACFGAARLLVPVVRRRL